MERGLEKAKTFNWEVQRLEERKPNLMYNLFLVYFVNLYMFREHIGPSSGGTTVCIQQLVLIIVRWLLCWLDWNQSNQDNSHLKRIKSTNFCIHTVVPPDDRPRCARHMYRLTKYIKNKSCIKLVFLYTIQGLVNGLYVSELIARNGNSAICWFTVGYNVKPFSKI
jgi:hypothetical protein